MPAPPTTLRPRLPEPELKFLVPPAVVPALLSRLGVMLRPHPAHAVSTLCSIYFDTARLDSFHEKASSFFAKTKYRLRWYEEPGSGHVLNVPAHLEIKRKHGHGRLKTRLALAEDVAELRTRPLDDPWFVHLFQRQFPHLELSTLRPQLEVRYVRHRFTHPVFPDAFCLDTQIHAARVHPAFPCTVPSQPVDFAVLEQKGRARDPLPELKSLLPMGLRRAAVSKFYILMRHQIPHLADS